MNISFCRCCGAKTELKIPDDGDIHLREVCTVCKNIHYRNPLNVVGTIPVWMQGDAAPQVLLCLRNIEPRKGFWTLPAGYLELGETLAAGAARETVEEAGAEFEIGGLFAVINVVRAGQIHFFHRATLTSVQFHPGAETIEARLFTASEIPWADLAFPSIKLALTTFFEDWASAAIHPNRAVDAGGANAKLERIAGGRARSVVYECEI